MEDDTSTDEQTPWLIRVNQGAHGTTKRPNKSTFRILL